MLNTHKYLCTRVSKAINRPSNNKTLQTHVSCNRNTSAEITTSNKILVNNKIYVKNRNNSTSSQVSETSVDICKESFIDLYDANRVSCKAVPLKIINISTLDEGNGDI